MNYAQAEDSRVDWEGALVQRARAGDSRAFERLYREHSGRVYGLCLRMTRDAQLAEDCTQDTFINAWRALDSSSAIVASAASLGAPVTDPGGNVAASSALLSTSGSRSPSTSETRCHTPGAGRGSACARTRTLPVENDLALVCERVILVQEADDSAAAAAIDDLLESYAVSGGDTFNRTALPDVLIGLSLRSLCTLASIDERGHDIAEWNKFFSLIEAARRRRGVFS